MSELKQYVVYAHPAIGYELVLDESEIAAVKAVEKGEATKEQQQLFFDTLYGKISPVGWPSIGESAQHTDFNEGKRMVGISLVRIVKTTYDQFKEIK